MLTYQIRKRIFRMKGNVTFPAKVKIRFHLLPKQPFGTATGGGRTTVRAKAASAIFNLNTGVHWIECKEPLDRLSVKIKEQSRTVKQKGEILTVVQRFESLDELHEFIQSIYFFYPLLLNLLMADPPRVDRVEGRIGCQKFRWELTGWQFPVSITTQEEQEHKIIDSWLRFDVISNDDNIRLRGALSYFHTACRLDRNADRPGEFLPEVILNFAKTLECLFPSGEKLETSDAARTGLQGLGYSADEIERDFIPVIYLRSQIDVAHVQLRLFTMTQLQTLHTYVERIEPIIQEMLNRLIQQVKDGTFELKSYDESNKNDKADKTIAKIADSMPPLAKG